MKPQEKAVKWHKPPGLTLKARPKKVYSARKTILTNLKSEKDFKNPDF
jgi:hypothetical protein